MKYLEVKENPNGTVTVSGNCVFTGDLYSVEVPKEGFDRWQQGEHIQNVLPNVSREDREFLISGTSPEGWKQMFGEED